MSAGDAALVLARNPGRDPGWRPPAGDEARAGSLHRALDGYAPSPLHDVRGLAAATGAGAVLLKDESSRFGLPAFKALGAWWAAACTVAGHLGEPALATAPAALRERAARAAPLTLACATEGNHGRAVARVARSLGVAAHVVVPEGTARTRVAAIEAEGALVERVAGDYDAAVAHAAGLAGPDVLVIADTSWPGYEEVPRRVVEGYGTIFAELDEQLAGRAVDLVLVPIGVGSLAAAAARHLRARDDGPPPLLVGVEPAAAACALASARAGHPVTVAPGPASIMAGLNCATPSAAAWPAVFAGFDAFCAIGDAHARRGLRRLAAAGLDRGACAGGVAGALEALLGDPGHRAALDLPDRPTVLALLTEGVTDPGAFAAAVGRPPLQSTLPDGGAASGSPS